MTALHIAIKNHSEEMVKYLLNEKNINVADSILDAIQENQQSILKLILDYVSDEIELIGQYGESCEFPDHVTPLMFAAQIGNYEIVELLLERGHVISRPHKPNCMCEQCRESYKTDDLLHAQTRKLNLYRAISNPAYICHTSDDPILTTFELSHELMICSKVFPEFRMAYVELSEQASKFVVELIGYCRSTHEVELVLKQTRGASMPHFIFPRLILAMDYKQKAFVASPNVQQVLETTWIGDWNAWRTYNFFIKILIISSRVFLLPFITIAFIIIPKSSLVKRISLPINKMISHVSSYITFLIITLLQSNADKKFFQRGPPSTGLEPFLILFVLGFIWNFFRVCFIEGPSKCFRIFSNWYDFTLLFIFISTFLLWTVAYYEVGQHNATLERKFWYYSDPILIAEGLFCIGTIMSFFRILFLCQLSYHLGPLQISLKKMCVDIAKFIIIFTVILTAFTAGKYTFIIFLKYGPFILKVV